MVVVSVVEVDVAKSFTFHLFNFSNTAHVIHNIQWEMD